MKIAIGIYVDNLSITGPYEDEIDKIKGLLKEKFEMKDLGRARNIFGIRITRNKDEIIIDQSQYTKTIVRDFSISGTNIYPTPMASNAVGELEFKPGRVCTESEIKIYLRLLGKIMYLFNTRPNLMFVTHKMTQYSHKACHNHCLALLRVLSYVEGTLDCGISYGRSISNIPYFKADHNIEVYRGSSRDNDLVIFADADYAGNPSDRKSITGIIMMLNGGAIAAVSKKQKSVATSKTNAEYVAASEGAEFY